MHGHSMGTEASLLWLVFPVSLGIIVAWGLKERDVLYCMKFALVTFILIVVLAFIHYVLGDNVAELLALRLPSKSSAAMAVLYSGVLGGLIRIIYSVSTRRKSKRKQSGSGSE